MAKINLATVGSGYLSQSSINANFVAIEDEFQDKVLYRDNPNNEPNSMNCALDMNGHPIINAGNISASPDLLTDGLEIGGIASVDAPSYQVISVNADGQTAIDENNSWFMLRTQFTGNLSTNNTDGLNAYNSFAVIDSVNADALQQVAAYQFTMRVTSDTVGTRVAHIADMGVTSAPTATNAAYRNWVASEASGFAIANAGGVTGWNASLDPDDYYSGSLFGGNDHPRLATFGGSSATFWYGIVGREINVEIETGASSFSRIGLFIVTGDNAASQAAGDDVAIGLSNKVGTTIPWKKGISFGMTWGVWPFDTASTLIGAQKRLYPVASPEAAINAGYGVDFNEVTFANYAFRSPGFSVDPDGDTIVRTLSLTDGITAPSATVGQAIIYVDSADGDLKVRFGDGTIKTIVVDT